MQKRISGFCCLVLLATAAHAAAQSAARPIPIPEESFLGRLGFHFSLQSWAGFDSNVLRLSGGGSDSYGEVLPSLSLEYPLSAATRLRAAYRLGVERFASTSLLNTTSHWGGFELFHRLSPVWSVRVYDALEKSNQPDLLTTQPLLSFASYTQNAEGLRLTRSGQWIELSFEYASHQRSYSRRFVTPSQKQSDVMHAFALTASRRTGERTAVELRAEYRWNLSNNPAYRYREPSLSGTLTWVVRDGLRLEVGEQLTALDFSQRPLSDDPLRNRSDVLTTTMLGVRKSLFPDVSLIGRYYYERDFSNEPRRKFSDHRLLVGLRVSVGRLARAPQPAVAASLEQPDAREIVNLGYEALLDRNYPEALRLNLRALSLDPRLAQAHTNAGVACYKLGKVDQAIEHWKHTLQLEPRNARVRRLLDQAQQQP
jgi:tetratricopeptide (TPR) repeat protein